MSETIQRKITTLALSTLLLTITACSSDNDAPAVIEEPPTMPDPTTPDPEPPQGEPVMLTTAGGSAMVTVDGTDITIDFPAGAVTEDTEIFIDTATLDDLTDDLSDIILALDFQPDGLAFAQPISISIPMSLDPNSTVVGILESEGEFESLSISTLTRNDEQSTQVLQFNIPHFSRTVVVNTRSSFAIQTTSTVLVDGQGTIEAVVTRGDSSTAFIGLSAMLDSGESSIIAIENSSLTFTPDIPTLGRNESSAGSTSFVCREEGNYTVSLNFMGSFDITDQFALFPGLAPPIAFATTLQAQGQCIPPVVPVPDATIARSNGFHEARVANLVDTPVSWEVTTFPVGDETESTTQTAGLSIDRGIAVNLVRLPTEIRECISTIDGFETQEEQSDENYWGSFDCPRSADGSNNPISDNGSGEFQLTNGQTVVQTTVDQNGIAVLTGEGFDTFNDSRLNTPESLSFLDDNGNVLPGVNSLFFIGTEPPQEFQSFDEGAQPLLGITTFDQLGSEISIEVTPEIEQLVTFFYTSEDGSSQLTGIIDVRPIPTPSDDETNVTTTLARPELVQYLIDNNIAVTEVSIAAVNSQSFGGNGIFDSEPSNDTGISVADTVIGSGVSLTTTLEGLTPTEVCPLPPASAPATRCTPGQREAILSVNGNDQVAIYGSVDGQFSQFFIEGFDFSTPDISRPAGIEATQGPDQCVFYSDAGGQLLLFDTNGQLLGGDGNGNLTTNGGALLTGRAQSTQIVEYLGYDFYSADGETDWKLFIAARADADGDANGFIDTTQIIRYDYAVTGANVLSNPMIIESVADSRDSFQDIEIVGDRVYVTQSLPGENDTIRVFDANTGQDLGNLINNLVSPRQITETLDGNLAVVDFPFELFRVIDSETGTTIREYRLGDGDNRGNDRLRGVAPLRNGDFLASGLSDINRAVVNQYTGFTQQVRDNDSSTGVFLGRACLP